MPTINISAKSNSEPARYTSQGAKAPGSTARVLLGHWTFVMFAAAIYFSSVEIDFSNVKQVWKGIREIKGKTGFIIS